MSHHSGRSVYAFDLDGTLVKGDIVEGSQYYIGLIELFYSIPGLVTSTEYPTYDAWRAKYDELVALNNSYAYVFPLDIYVPETMYPYVVEYWKTTISKFFVKYTLKRLKQQAKHGQVWIVSASPLAFMTPILDYVPQISKIVAIERDKTISYGVGKLTRIAQEIGDLKYLRAATIDSWYNDGPMAAYICNNRSCPDVVYIEHGQTSDNNKKNLARYPIEIVHAYSDK